MQYLRKLGLSASLLLIASAGAVLAAGGLVQDSLIKANDSAVYYYASDGNRYVIPNRATYDSWFSSFSFVTTVSDEVLAQIPFRGQVTYRPGVRLVKIRTSPKVYAVARGGKLRWIESEELAVKLYGEDWAEKVDDIPETFFANYNEGESVKAEGDFDPLAAAAEVQTINANKGLPDSEQALKSDTAPDVSPRESSDVSEEITLTSPTSGGGGGGSSPTSSTSSTPSPSPTPPASTGVGIDVGANAIRGPSAEFEVHKLVNGSVVGLPVVSITFRQIGSLTDSDIEFVSYLQGSVSNFVTVPISNGTFTINYNPIGQSLVLLNPKIRESGYGKTWEVQVTGVEVQLDAGETLGTITGLNQSFGYIHYPEYDLGIQKGESNRPLIEYCDDRFLSPAYPQWQPTYDWFNDYGCMIPG